MFSQEIFTLFWKIPLLLYTFSMFQNIFPFHYSLFFILQVGGVFSILVFQLLQLLSITSNTSILNLFAVFGKIN